MKPLRFKKIHAAREFTFWVSGINLLLPYGAREISPGVFEVLGGERPYRTSVTSCDCPSRKKPCKHMSGLAFELAKISAGREEK